MLQHAIICTSWCVLSSFCIANREEVCYTSVTMRELKLLIAIGCVALLPMCDQVEGPLPAGSVQATDAQADALMQQAIAARAAGKIGKAKSLLEKVALRHALAPCAPQARIMLGEIEEQLNDPRSAFKQYAKVVENYQGSELYPQALNRQLAMATAAASGKLKGRVAWLWDVPMEESVVIEWLESVIQNAPYGDMAATACSVLGDYMVRQKRFDEAAAVYRRLVENYPDSSYAPAAQLMVANLWASSHTRGNQNLVHLDRAREAYEEFPYLFPGHADSAKAKEGARNMQRLLVQQELEVGRYYLERAREYSSAIFCLENVIRQKNANPEAAAEAQELLARAQAHLPAAAPTTPAQ